MKKRNTYAIICARGGSKRVKGKNLLLINEKPLIAYSIEAALKSKIFSKVYINSEDSNILSTGRNYGAETFLRSNDLATDTTFLLDVIKDQISSLDFLNDDIIAILFPTCPLRTDLHISEAYDLFNSSGEKNPVVSVTKYEYPIQVSLKITETNDLSPVFEKDYKKSTRHNDHDPTYHANYAVIFNTVGKLKTQEKLIGENAIPYIMPYIPSIDIDEPHQLELIRIIMKASQINSVENDS
jgi:CMP-N-acetylneuraminic acid synthetase